MGGKVYSYIRFSDARQATGASVERQAGIAQAWAAEHGLTLDDSLSMRDEGLSAYHQRHVRKGALGVFLKAAEDGRVEPGSVLLVESLDRLSRAEPLTALAQMTSIIDAGIAVAGPEQALTARLHGAVRRSAQLAYLGAYTDAVIGLLLYLQRFVGAGKHACAPCRLSQSAQILTLVPHHSRPRPTCVPAPLCPSSA